MRSIAGDDYPSVVQLLDENENSVHERPRQVSLDDLGHWLASTHVATDTWLVEDEQGIAAVGWANTDDGAATDAIGFVHPRAKGRGWAHSSSSAPRRGLENVGRSGSASSRSATTPQPFG